MLKTSMYNKHKNLNAKILPYAGYLMPINYSKGIQNEYNAVMCSYKTCRTPDCRVQQRIINLFKAPTLRSSLNTAGPLPSLLFQNQDLNS